MVLLHLNQREVEGIAILELKGRLVIGAEAEALQQAFANLADTGAARAILNFKHVAFIDSTGLGVLVGAHTRFNTSGGGLKLLNLSSRHLQLLVLTKLATVFEIFDDEQAAIDSFFPDREVKRFDILEFVKSQENEDQ